MLRALVEFRIRGVKVCGPFLLVNFARLAQPQSPDEHPILIPPLDPRHLYRWKDLDNGVLLVEWTKYCGS